MQSEEFIQVKKHIESFDYQVVDFDFERPWGGSWSSMKPKRKSLLINF